MVSSTCSEYSGWQWFEVIHGHSSCFVDLFRVMYVHMQCLMYHLFLSYKRLLMYFESFVVVLLTSFNSKICTVWTNSLEIISPVSCDYLEYSLS